jgi:hypothetical protein
MLEVTMAPHRPRRVVALCAAALAVVAVLVGGYLLWPRPAIALGGTPTPAVVGEHADKLAVRVSSRHVNPAALHATVDRTRVPVRRDGSRYVVRPGHLADGVHTLTVSGGGATRSWRFTVDSTGPALAVQPPTDPPRLGKAVEVTGTVANGARLAAPGATITRHGTAFTARYPAPPGPVTVTATDRLGNTTSRQVDVEPAYPAGVRAIHLSGYAWAYQPYHDSAVALIRQHRVNAVELDVKEEDGIVDADLGVPLAAQIGAVTRKYDAAAAVAQLHALGARVIGRVVAFRDPVLGGWAWNHGHHDWAVQAPGGGPYTSGYGSGVQFTNLASAPVRQYNLDLAAAAVRKGFDDIVFDYIRRPDGPPSGMAFPGLAGPPDAAIAAFCGQARARLHQLGAYLGAAVFAQAVLRPADTAQNPAEMARNLDVLVPMDYPNHWDPGSYGVADPASQPYPVVARSLADWQRAVHGTGCALVPWLWASNDLGAFTAGEAADEIRAARANGITGWFVWNAQAHYEDWTAAFTPDAPSVRW